MGTNLAPVRALLVENSQEDADLIVLELRYAGFAPEHRRVANREELQAALAAAPWDIVLCDYIVPGLGCSGVLTLIGELCPDTPIIIIVSSALPEAAALEAFQNGAHDVITKSQMPRLGPVLARELDALRIRQRERAALQQLRESEYRFRTLLERSADGFAVLDRDGRLTYPGRSVLGYPIEEFRGRTPFELAHPEDQQRIRTAFQELLAAEDRPLRIEYRARDARGEWRWVEAVGKNLLSDPVIAGLVVNFRDVTERKQFEEDLLNARSRLTQVLDSIQEAFLAVDRDWRFTFANQRVAALVGNTPETLIGQSLWEVFPEAQYTELHAQFHRVMQARVPAAFEVYHAPIQRWFEVHVYPATVGLTAYIHDISTRKEAEEAKRSSEAGYRLLTETVHDGIIKINEDSEILFANAACGRIFGYQAEELVGQRLTVLMPEYLRCLHEAALRRYLITGEKHLRWDGVELPGRHRSGQEIPVEISFGEYVDGERHTFTGIIRDISTRKHAEQLQSMRHAVTRVLSEHADLAEIAPRILRALAEHLRWPYGAFWTVDRLANVLRCVEVLETGSRTRFGDQCREAECQKGVGLPGRVWRAGAPCWIENLAEDTNFPHLHAALQLGLHSAFAFPILRGGEILGVMEFFSPEMRAPDGELLEVVDVTGRQIGDFLERRWLQEQMQQTQRLESLGILAGGIAHDFNNLLTGIMGSASLADQTIPPGHPAKDLLQDTIAATESAAHLTRQLLAYTGKGRFVIERINLSELVRGMLPLLQRTVPKNIAIRSELAENLPSVEADASQIQQVLMNLVINGAEAIPDSQPGLVTVVTRTAEAGEGFLATTFWPADLAPGAYVFLEVHDTGSGIDEATLSKIFDPFFTTKFTGRGLGLAAVQGIVRGHKGGIQVRSTPENGTSFQVFFPASFVPATSPATGSEPDDLAGRGAVLVVDDEESVRRVAHAVLTRYGYKVFLAADGQEAVRVFQQEQTPILAVLLDLTMPGMSGEETLRCLKGLRPEVRVLLSSGYNEVEATRRLQGQHPAGFIQKPYTAAKLGEAVRAILTTDDPHN